eukprot:CAMPEP_0184735198 /NCGR_PEP_ID=MMETSP0314-20130426/61744_1 /TAXON_ID=38298 /ORGANISM="Rhodella maculata, Strain CCMP 736" /LENGTH=317 /DNA_ID=CAMNT_0027202229 /DNA_START=622 /DNA_END=1575 /DNA_ORIENTATION=-
MSLPATYKAAVVREFGSHGIEVVPLEPPAPGQVTVKVNCTGVCHTDLHAQDGDWPVKPKMPLVGGHEGAGTVVALGDGVTDLKIGDRVGIVWLHSACGSCEFCVKGNETVCPKQLNSGYGADGDRRPLVTTYKALKETEVKPGETVVIVGAGGGLGHLAVQYAVAMGMKVIAVDGGDKKKELCESLGAFAFVDFTKVNTVDKIMELTDGQGAHGTLVLATNERAFSDAVNYSRRYGTMVMVGLPPGSMAMPIFPIVLKRITLRGSIVGTRQDLKESLQFAADGKVKCIIQERKLEDLAATFEEMKKGEIAGRIVLNI